MGSWTIIVLPWGTLGQNIMFIIAKIMQLDAQKPMSCVVLFVCYKMTFNKNTS